MPQTHRLGDCNTAGGCVNGIPQSTVFVNNLLQVVDGSVGTSHPPCPIPVIHCQGVWVTVQNTVKEPTNVFVENIPAGYQSNVDTCGHARAAGSPNVFINSFGEGGSMVDNNVPYNSPGIDMPPIPAEAQPSPPAGYTDNTPADVQSFIEHDDPDGTVAASPPPGTTERPTEEIEDDPTPPPMDPPPTQDCSTVDALPDSFTWTSVSGDFASWASSFALSPNFTVADLTINCAVTSVAFTSAVTQAQGLTQKQILQNMCYHAKTVLEPLLATYGTFTITSGFRNRSNGSQHNRGQATDIQFLNLHGAGVGSAYFQRAQEYRDAGEYDQFILEWFGRNPWFHVSSNPAGHRKNVLTQTGSSSYAPGLKQLRP